MSRYRKGAKFENDVKDFLESKCYFCLRSAGSKSLVDIVAFGKYNYANEILFIQCKYGDATVSKKDRYALYELSLRYGCIPMIAYRKKYQKVIHWINLMGCKSSGVEKNDNN